MSDNKLIAEFMGLEQTPTGLFVTKKGAIRVWELEYHISWDWLMPVVEKINTMEPSEFNYHVDNMTRFRMEQGKIQMLSITSPMRIVYSAVLDFIKWYNKTKNQ